MKRSFVFLSLATALVASVTSIQSFDYLKERYARFMLGNTLYQVLQDRVADGKCDSLKNSAEVRKVVAENRYVAPFWVKALNRVSSYESLVDYATNLYRVAVNVLDVIEEKLKKAFPNLNSLSTAVRGNMDFVLIGRAQDIDQQQIEGNIQQVRDVLNRYKADVLQSQISQDDKTRLANAIDVGLENIKNAEPRLTQLERWHREMQIERFNRYVSRYCK